jgi:alkaline phosphatase D
LQPIWAAIQDYDPEVFIWLGDNIYADSKLPVKFVGKNRTSGPWKNIPRFYQTTLDKLEEMYEAGKNIPGYKAIREKAEVSSLLWFVSFTRLGKM